MSDSSCASRRSPWAFFFLNRFGNFNLLESELRTEPALELKDPIPELWEEAVDLTDPRRELMSYPVCDLKELYAELVKDQRSESPLDSPLTMKQDKCQ